MPWTARLAVVVATLALTSSSASAAVINVEATTDPPTSGNGFCELREALSAADNNNAAGGGDCTAGDGSGNTADTVNLPAGTYNTTSQLVINSKVILDGAGAATTIIDAGSNDRVFNIGAGGVDLITVQDVTITHGKANEQGGGIWSSTPLKLANVVVTANDAGPGTDAINNNIGGEGYGGGGIYASGDLTLDNTTVSNNRAGDGGTGGPGTGVPPYGNSGGTGGSGGGIFVANAKLTITNSTISGNSAGMGGIGGQPPGGSNGTAGAGGAGGGIAASGDTTITGSTISGNSGGTGGDALMNTSYTNPGGGGRGGGIAQTDGSLTLTDSAVTSNHAGAPGATGSGPNAFGGFGGSGGGISTGDFNQPVTVSIARVTVVGNTSGNGTDSTAYAGGAGVGAGIANGGGSTMTVDSSNVSGNTTGTPGVGANGGFGGYGGGIYNEYNSTLTVTNSTVSGNHMHPTSGSGDKTAGGGIYNANGATTTVTQSTIAGNTVGTGSLGGGIASNHHAGFGNLTLSNNIIAGNDSNCSSPDAPITDGGHNVTFGDATCPGTNADPKLGALANNGGPTQTMAIDEGSAAIDAVPAAGAGCPATDQRGVARPQRSACDAGAYERDIPPPASSNNDQNQTPVGDTTTQTPVPISTPADTTRATIKLTCNKKQKLRAALKKGLQCAFTTNEAGTGTVSAARICSGKATVTKAGTRKLACKFTKKAKKKFAKAKKLRLKLVLVFKDAAGNQSRKTLTLTLRR